MKKKQMVIIFILSFAMAMTVTACGKENEVNETEVVGSVVDIEAITEEIPTEDVEEMNNSVTEVPVEFEEVNTEDDTNTQIEQQATEEVTKPSEQQQPTEEPKEQLMEQTKEQELIEQSVPTATLNGKITSVGNGEFVIRKANVISSDVMVSSGEDAEKVSLIYTDSTEFVLCSTSDGGITADYSSTSSSSLCSCSMVEIEGAYEGDSFMARKVTIYNFQ